MADSLLSKGSISFRAGPKSVAFILVKYGDKSQTLKSVRYEDLAIRAEEISKLLSSYPGSELRWDKFRTERLPEIREEHDERKRLLSYESIMELWDQIVWSLERHRETDKTGENGGKNVGIQIWGGWHRARTTISSASHWNVSEKAAKEALGMKSENIVN